MNNITMLTREDLSGRSAISYFRFSSPHQRHGSSIERQEDIFAECLEWFGLNVARGFQDRGLSGSKGHNRKRGQLRDLLTMIRNGEIERGTVLIIEDVHRLSREGATTVWPILADLVAAGIVLVVGVTRKIWCEARLNSSENHELHAAINGARAYADNLSHMAAAAHASRRRKMAEGIPVLLTGVMPGWLDRPLGPDGRRTTYVPNERAEILRRMWTEAAEGRSTRMIADRFNRERVPDLHGNPCEWRPQQVGFILKDRRVLGYHTPKRRRENSQYDALGAEARVYPQIIDDALWTKAREMLSGKKTLAGRPGKAITNLFSSKAFCATCGAAMRVDTSGVRAPKRRRHYICSRNLESKLCPDKTRYDLMVLERRIVMALIRLADIAPRSVTTDTRKLDDDIARIKIDIEAGEASLDYLRPKIGKSVVFAEQFEKQADDLDDLRKRKSALEIVRSQSLNETTRAQDVWKMAKATLGPAVAGDVDARDRLRGILAPIKFRIVGDGHGGLRVSYHGHTVSLHPDDDLRDELAT